MGSRGVVFWFVMAVGFALLFGGCSCEVTAYKNNEQAGCPCQVEQPAPAGEAAR